MTEPSEAAMREARNLRYRLRECLRLDTVRGKVVAYLDAECADALIAEALDRHAAAGKVVKP